MASRVSGRSTKSSKCKRAAIADVSGRAAPTKAEVRRALALADQLAPPDHPKGVVLYVRQTKDRALQTQLALEVADALGVLAYALRAKTKARA